MSTELTQVSVVTAGRDRADGADGADGGGDALRPGRWRRWSLLSVTLVGMLWPLPLLLSVSVEAGWQLGRLTKVADGDGADGSVDGADGIVGGDCGRQQSRQS